MAPGILSYIYGSASGVRTPKSLSRNCIIS